MAKVTVSPEEFTFVKYDAAVIAVHRNGERVPGKIGEIVLRAGDTLLLQTAPGFIRAHRNSPDFYLTSEIAETRAPRYERAWVAVGVLVAKRRGSTKFTTVLVVPGCTTTHTDSQYTQHA